MEWAGNAGDSHVKLKNIWRELLNSRIAGIAIGNRFYSAIYKKIQKRQ